MNLDAQRGTRIREERDRLGWSQQEAADTVGIRREMWAKYEAGAEPGAKALAEMAKSHVDVTYILTGERASDWERDVLTRTAEVVAKMEPAGDGPISQKMLQAYKLTPAQQKTRRGQYNDLEVMLDRCNDDDLAMVVNLAWRLAIKGKPS